MLDDRFERDLRAALRARDPGPAPATVFERAAGIRDREPGARWAVAGRTLSRLGGLVAAATVAVAAVGVLLLSRSLGISLEVPPGGGATPSPIPFDPAIDGAGIVGGPTGMEVGAITVVAIVAAVISSALLKRLLVRGLVLGLLAVLVVATYAFSRWDALDWQGGAWAPGIGYVGSDPSAAEGSLGGDPIEAELYVVPPNGILTFGLDVHNRAAVPIAILGLAADHKDLAWGRITAAGMLRDPTAYSLAPADTRPFAPLAVEPDGFAFIVVVGRAGPCATGRVNSGDEISASAQLNQLDVVYEMLGFRKQTTIDLPATINLPYDSQCQPSELINSPAP